ncbi:hypothetical protein FB192DRAFT_1476279 [Mucor lusitanicus]|uniref:DUF1688 family protein n=2 Tax=Mucor circinelloides f. lusitanicus TaxID=29924 RepID=A0A168GER2_MUCCL|nr:hypothetical protein FB192DRAFT_1476279 [Mucor lusitanicus]OAC97620.1 hypothetical protein MUCCIDRAFT_116279 [Mucor lusitanicus CBS 277.49]
MDGFQVTEENPVVGLEDRSNLLKRLAEAIEDQPTYSPSINEEPQRPCNLIDFVLSSVEHDAQTKSINGIQLGDVWPCASLTDLGNHENLVPFHKLSQWPTYSLIEAMELSLGIVIEDMEQMTGLPEYRNGGLLVDYGLLKLKPEQIERGTTTLGSLPTFEDNIKQGVEDKLGRKLQLAQVLEGGTWTAGREIAAKLRPKDGGPPIVIKSDGTIF